MADDLDPPQDDPEILAGELALGLLEGSDRAAALRLMLADPGFARRVYAWRAYLAPFDDAIAELSPPTGLWRSIDRRLSGADRGALVRWRAAAIAATALAAALLGVIALRAPAPLRVPVAAPAPQLVAQLGAPQATALLAVYEDQGGNLIVRPAVVDAHDRDAELWVIPKGGKPVSLGVIARDRPTRVALGTRRSLLSRDAILAVSLEPIGGSPTGQPTGPVVAQGAISTI
jgi:anti-sigma-K factor RskA